MKKFLFLAVFCFLSVSIFAENKYAILIANSKYRNFSSLDGPINEARDLSISLRSIGFTVELIENATREQMIDGLDSIKQKISGKGGVALFHYGGHGVQAQGKNYLIPVDADIPDERKLPTRAVDIDEIMSSLDSCGSDTNIVILDACRNNPLPAGAGRSASRGLSVVGVKPKNSIIVYSAEAGTVAQDGLFTPALTKLITQNDKSLNQILMQVRKEVSQKSNGTQIPGEYNQLFDDVFLSSRLTMETSSKGEKGAFPPDKKELKIDSKWELVLENPIFEPINAITVSNDILLIAGIDSKTLYSIDGLKITKIKTFRYRITGICYTSKGLWITSNEYPYIILLDEKYEETFKFPIPNSLNSTTVYVDKDYIYNTGFTGKIFKFDIKGHLIKTIKSPIENMEGLVVINDLIYVNSFNDGEILILNQDGNVINKIETPIMLPLGLTFDGINLILSGQKSSGIYKCKIY
jgi:hypothetical protein